MNLNMICFINNEYVIDYFFYSRFNEHPNGSIVLHQNNPIKRSLRESLIAIYIAIEILGGLKIWIIFDGNRWTTSKNSYGSRKFIL